MVQRIRNPLNALQLNLDGLTDELGELNIDSGENVRERLKRIQKGMAELDSLLCEVLRLTDLPTPQITTINVNALVAEVQKFLKLESSKNEVTLKLALQQNLPAAQADPVQIKQAILSFLLNAIEACRVEDSITLATESQRDRIIIKVTDSGEGIPLDHRDRIFEPFFSTKEGHAGLGLPLALEIVRAHQGKISFASEVGQGTTFFMSLPARGGAR
ncbi:MAG: hypothetical protein HY695_34705 [Deltaproteobacteria bacterium]|nr:hypothetical protein [Deltaproteobacteria bacterium]